MIISASTDYQPAARRRLPPFLFHYLDGGAYAEYTLRHNVSDLSEVALRQRVLNDMSELDLSTRLFDETLSMPVALAPVGLTGMYARRGEVQAARAADAHGIPFTMSTVSVCPIEEVAPKLSRPMWFQLYVLRDRGFMKSVLERAQAAGVSTLVFTVDMPVPGARYRDAHSGMSGPFAEWRRYLQAVLHPRWAWDVGIYLQRRKPVPVWYDPEEPERFDTRVWPLDRRWMLLMVIGAVLSIMFVVFPLFVWLISL